MAVKEELLRRHVMESNKIEMVDALPGNSLYDRHLVAALMAAQGEFIHPNRLYTTIFSRGYGLMKENVRPYRTCNVVVGERMMPEWKNVPALMDEWEIAVKGYLAHADENVEALANGLHAWLLCIHPYPDGNGRTARLVWNMLRVCKGFSWFVVEARAARGYYANIREFEDRVFKKSFPDVYPKQ